MWDIVQESVIDTRLKKFKSNKQLLDNFHSFMNDVKWLNDNENPSKLGTRKRGRYKNCFGRHLTKSHTLIFSINHDEHVVHLIDLDDHKTLYGRDNKS